MDYYQQVAFVSKVRRELEEARRRALVTIGVEEDSEEALPPEPGKPYKRGPAKGYRKGGFCKRCGISRDEYNPRCSTCKQRKYQRAAAEKQA